MRKISVVTSCSKAGWDQYGRRFFETFDARWPREVALHVVSEDLKLEDLGDLLGKEPRREEHAFHDLMAYAPARKFLEDHALNERYKGRVMIPGDFGWTPKKIAAGYNFRLDAYRFAKKVFSIAAVAARIPDGLLFWCDADVVTFADVPAGLLPSLLPSGAALCCLDRGELYHSECGFVGYDLDYPATREFISAFERLYSGGEVFALKEWHDSWVFDWLRRKMLVPTAKIEHCSRHQPFMNSKLGRYMDHLKGESKKLGRSPTRHLSANRDVPYWRDPR